jgi:hypothetical protein
MIHEDIPLNGKDLYGNIYVNCVLKLPSLSGIELACLTDDNGNGGTERQES